jgi:hypothetical protein
VNSRDEAIISKTKSNLNFIQFLPHTELTTASLQYVSIVTVRENTIHLLSDHYKTHIHCVGKMQLMN